MRYDCAVDREVTPCRSSQWWHCFQVRARRKPGAVADATVTQDEGALQVEQVWTVALTALGMSNKRL